MSTVVCWFQRTLKQLEREQTDTQTHRTTTVTLAHARQGLMKSAMAHANNAKHFVKQNSWVSENCVPCTLPPRNTFVNTTKFTKVFTYASFYEFPPIQHVYTVTPILMQQLLTLSSMNNNYFPGLVGKQEMCSQHSRQTGSISLYIIYKVLLPL